MAQKLETARVGPLEVVEDEHDRPVRTDIRKQAHDGGEQEEALGVGVGGLGRRRVRDTADERRYQSGQFRSMNGHMDEELFLGGVRDELPKRLGEELVGVASSSSQWPKRIIAPAS